ncbi:uncharacterized protein [Venturia canescens]|nr:uncharacterized protein LOC122410256 isoform X2 [Venturia canescens]
MDLCLRIGFQTIKHYIDFNPATLKKGSALTSTHVVQVEECFYHEINSSIIRCNVIRQTSVTLPPYKVQLEIDNNRNITNVECDCVSAAGKKCKHICALICYINSDRSATQTSLNQKWGRPSRNQLGKEMYAKGIIITEQFKTKNVMKLVDASPYVVQLSDVTHPCALGLILAAEERLKDNAINEKTMLCNVTRLTSLNNELSWETCVMNLIIFAEESELYVQECFFSSIAVKSFYEKYIQLSQQEIIELCIRTVDQSNCFDWFMARKLRITASSKAHAIKTRTKRNLVKMIEAFLNVVHTKSYAAMQYGQKMEKIAREHYETLLNVQVLIIGTVVLQAQPWLSASPDGVVIEDGCITKLVEIKCPYSCKNVPVYDKILNTFNVPYLVDVNNNVELKSTHQYYTQCQMQMYVTGLSHCDLFVWSPKEGCVVPVSRDDSFLKGLIPKLHSFYFNHYLQKLCESDKENINPK